MPQLVELTGPYAGRIHAIPYGEHVIGRGGDADVQLQDKDVSRRHARIEVVPEGVVLHDLGSKNGVYARGQRVVRPVFLTHGETMSFGKLTLSVSHPSSHVNRVLNDAGETTVTTTATQTGEPGPPTRLVLPILGVLVFGAMLVALLSW